MSQQLYPLRFTPIFRQYLWGGRRLATMLNKKLGDDANYAESWEIVDHGQDQSVVTYGDLAGQTLRQLISNFGTKLLGHSADRFPLLLKFLDAHRDLSVQVHPNDAQAAQLEPPDLGKTEAWYVMHADPGSRLYCGLRDGVDRATLHAAIERGGTEELLHWIEPAVGDSIFIPAGVVHAIGSGLVVAEIQQASDTTFRIFDWNRLDANGQSRPLHVEAALAVTDFERGPIYPQTPQVAKSGIEQLVSCDKFVMDRRHIADRQTVGGDGAFHILVVVDGGLTIQEDPSDRSMTRGENCLLPAELTAVTITPEPTATVLDIRLPIAASAGKSSEARTE